MKNCHPSTRNRRGERGAALLELALTLPLLLLVSVGIFEFGRCYQTWQVVTNAAREGARLAVLPSANSGAIEARIRGYMQDGQLVDVASATVTIDSNSTIPVGAANASASVVTVTYPFNFIVLNPVARLVVGGSGLGSAPVTITASSAMRNETQF
jgi:Flp pilus assembly protein TadG